MPNFVPYLILIAAALSLLITTIVQRRQYFVVAMHLSFAGMIYLFEVFVLVIFQGYSYHLELMPHSHLDSMIGAVASNLITVPAVGIFIAFHQLRWPWMFAFALLLGGMDVLFVHLDIYRHAWWKSYYSVVTAFLFFWICTRWLQRMKEGRPVTRYLTSILYTFCVIDSMLFIPMLMGWRRVHFGIYENIERDDVISTVITALCIAFVICNAAYWSDKRRYWPAAWMFVLACLYGMNRLGYLDVKIPLWLYALSYLLILVFATWLSRIGFRSMRAAAEHDEGNLRWNK